MYSFDAGFLVVRRCCVLTAFTSFPIVLFRSGFGIASAMQYFRFRPSRRLAFFGGCIEVHKLWNARFVGWVVIKESLMLRMAWLKFLMLE